MEKVIVYGLGRAWNKLKTTISNAYDIVGYVDENKSISNEIMDTDELLRQEFDYILITPMGCKCEIINHLRELGIKEEKLIPYLGENIFIDKKSVCCNGDELIAKLEKCKIYLKTLSDEAVFKEIFISREYDIAIPGDISVIDIGMNVGISSIFFALKDEVKSVYGFEPFENTYEDALRNIENCAEKEKIHPYKLGLSNKSESMVVNYNNADSESMSIVVDNKGDRCIEVEIVDAGDQLKDIIIEEKSLGRRIVCKIDCEGSEYDIFESLEKASLIRKIDAFLIEWHYWDDDRITKILMKNDYIFMKNYANNKRGHIIAWKDYINVGDNND